MKERPILFSAPMARALLAGTKTQTRRIVKPQHILNAGEPGDPETLTRLSREYGAPISSNQYGVSFDADGVSAVVSVPMNCPFGGPGDRLWVREGFTHITGNGIRTHYRADGEPTDRDGNVLPTEPGLRRWMSPLFMPRKESRITLDVVAIRVERLHDITEADAKAEGVTPFVHDPEGDCWTARTDVHRSAFEYLWGEINGWNPSVLNPWVWVVEFTRVQP